RTDLSGGLKYGHGERDAAATRRGANVIIADGETLCRQRALEVTCPGQTLGCSAGVRAAPHGAVGSGDSKLDIETILSDKSHQEIIALCLVALFDFRRIGKQGQELPRRIDKARAAQDDVLDGLPGAFLSFRDP